MAWSRVRGHDSVTRAVADAWRRGRLGHAYLFAGPPGVGKRLFATELAKALLCEAPPPDRLEACDHCPSCRLVDAGTHPDLFAVARPADSTVIPVRVMLQLGADLSLKPARGRRKVAIIDDADDLNDESANSFLKTLEEPPPGSVLILIGTAPELQLATIRSRCQLVRFAPLPADVVKDLLLQQGVSEELIGPLLHLAAGSPGQALELADPELWEFRKRLVSALTAAKPDTVAAAKEWMEFVEEAGKESAVQRRRAGQVLRLLIAFLGQALTAPATDGDAAARAIADRLGPDRLLQLLERSLEADHHLDRKVQLVLALEALTDAFRA
jgi:DNA polymerase III subunit delta'